MPQGSKAERNIRPCPNCGGITHTIYWKGGFGLANEALETHCNRCGWAKDAQTGEIRNTGTQPISLRQPSKQH